MYLHFSLLAAGLLCIVKESNGISTMTTIRPTVTNSPPTPAENFTEGNDQDMSKLLEGLVLAWIPAASIGVLLILVGFLILVVKTISRRRRRKIIIKKKQTRDQVGVDRIKMDSYFSNPCTNLDPTEQEPNPKAKTMSLNAKEVMDTTATKSEPNYYATEIQPGCQGTATTGQVMINKEEHSTFSTIAPTDEECIYDNDPPTRSQMTTNEAYGTFTASNEEECIYDNDPPTSSRMTTNEAYGTFTASNEEECIYDNDPPNNSNEECIYDNDLPNNPETFYTIPTTVPNTEEECIYDNDPTNEPTVSLINNSDNIEDNIYDN